MRRRRRLLLVCGIAVTALLVAVVVAVRPGGAGAPSTTPAPNRCDRKATTSTFADEVAAATAGQVVCLASGSYGDWGGVNKPSPGITLREQKGATATFGRLDLRDASSITFDGLDYQGGVLCGPSHDITIRNAEQTGFFQVAAGAGPEQNNTCTSAPQMASANVLWDNVRFTMAACPDGSCLLNEGRLSFAFGSTVDAGITIRNSTFTGNCGDGVQFSGSADAGRGVRLLGNDFVDLTQADCNAVFPGADASAPHSDSIQFVGGGGTTIEGNWFRNVATAIVKYDGSGSNIVVRENVFGPNVGGDALCLGGTAGAIVEHNVFRSGGLFLCANHEGDPNADVVWRNNIQHQSPVVQGSSGYAIDDFNLCTAGTCAGANSLRGAPTFAGGPKPSTYAGFALAPGSLGTGAASDGTDIGINP